MNIEAMARACGMMAYTDVSGRLQIDGDNGKITEFAALVRAEALREAAGIVDNYWYKTPGAYAAAILAAIDSPPPSESEQKR